MKKWVVVAVMALVALVPAAWAQGRLGMGGSFMGGLPVFDAFTEVGLAENFALRLTFSYIASFAGITAFGVDTSFLLVLGLEAVQPYFGAGGGAIVLTGEGEAVGAFTANGLLGAYFPLGPGYGIYGQMRFLGSVTAEGFQGSFAPGIGLYIPF